MSLRGFGIGFFVLAGCAISDHLVFLQYRTQIILKTTLWKHLSEMLKVKTCSNYFSYLQDCDSSALPSSIIFKNVTVSLLQTMV